MVLSLLDHENLIVYNDTDKISESQASGLHINSGDTVLHLALHVLLLCSLVDVTVEISDLSDGMFVSVRNIHFDCVFLGLSNTQM